MAGEWEHNNKPQAFTIVGVPKFQRNTYRDWRMHRAVVAFLD